MNRYPFPKVELHLHLDGSISPETMWELAEKEQIALPVEKFDDFRPWLRMTANCRNVDHYLERFALPCSLLQSAENLSYVTEDLIKNLAAQNYAYAEIRFAPQKHCDKGMTQRDAIEAVLAGRKSAQEKYPSVETGIILCAMSIGSEAINMKENLETAALAAEYLGKGVVGCDLAGTEGIVPLTNYRPFTDACHKNNVPLTMHGGEGAGAQSVREILPLYPARIGHGHHIWDDPALCEEALKRGITFEICPTSNVQCRTQPSYEAHPAKKMFDYGLRVTINNDNMVLAATNLEEEYDHCINEMGFTREQIVQMNIYAAEAAFLLPEEKRKAIIDTLKKYL